MAFNISTIKNEVDAAVNKATSLVDLCDKYADLAAKYADAVPGVGAEVQTVVTVLDDLDKALHEAQSVLGL